MTWLGFWKLKQTWSTHPSSGLPDTPGYARTHLVYPVASTNGGGHAVVSMNGCSGDDVSDESDVSED